MPDHKYIYKIRVNYKSGIQEEFWVKEFHISRDEVINKVEWLHNSDECKPLFIGVGSIESVWQVGYKEIK